MVMVLCFYNVCREVLLRFFVGLCWKFVEMSYCKVLLQVFKGLGCVGSVC